MLRCVSVHHHMALKRSFHEAPTARLPYGEHREVHMRGEHQHRWHSSTKGRRQGLVPSLWDHHNPPSLNRIFDVVVDARFTEFTRIGMFMVVPQPHPAE